MDNGNGNADETFSGEYSMRKLQKKDDIAAMQTLVCVLAAAALMGLNLLRPELCGELMELIMGLTSDGREIIENPLGFLPDI